jgi:hypothetical protein
MTQQVCVVVSAEEREQLAAITIDRNRPRKHVERARIVVAAVDRHSAQRVAQSIGVSGPTVWRWQQRFAESGVDGLLRDKTRKPGKPPIAAETAARVVALTCTELPHRRAAGPVGRWPKPSAARWVRCSASGVRTNGNRTGCVPSNVRAIPALPPNWPISSGFISIHRRTRWCCRLTKRARSRRSTAPNPACRSSRVGARP